MNIKPPRAARAKPRGRIAAVKCAATLLAACLLCWVCLIVLSCGGDTSSARLATEAGVDTGARDGSTDTVSADGARDAWVNPGCAQCLDACGAGCYTLMGTEVRNDGGCVADASRPVVCEPTGFQNDRAWCAVRLSDGHVFLTGSAPIDGCQVVRACTEDEYNRAQLIQHNICQ